MKTTILLLIFCCLLSGQGMCQTKFIRTYSGQLPDFSSIKKCSDKGYIMAGAAYHSSLNAAIYKTDSMGHMLWGRKLEHWSYERFQYAQETHNGGYIAVGSNQVTGPSIRNIMLTKFTSSGILSWNKSIGMAGTSSGGLIVHEDEDHGYTIAGENSLTTPTATLSRCYLVKTDSLGEVIWGRLFQLPFEIGFTGACRTTDGGHVFLGFKEVDTSGFNIILLKADEEGNFLWAKTIGGPDDEFAYGITATSHNGVMLAGGTDGYNCDSTDILLISLDSAGSIVWAKTYGAPGHDDARSVMQTNDGGFILTGRIGFGAVDNNKGLGLKTNANGFVYWARTYIAGNRYPTFAIEQTDDGGYAITGSVSDGAATASLIKTDASGHSCDDAIINLWSQSISIPSADIPITVDSGGTSVAVNLPVASLSGEHLLCDPLDVTDVSVRTSEVQVYPNPSYDGRFTVAFPGREETGTIEVYNGPGQKVKSQPLSERIDLSDMPGGVYHYSIMTTKSQRRMGGTMVYR